MFLVTVLFTENTTAVFLHIQVQVACLLLALAKQVKTLLSQFPADDPAKAGLKESPAYRKVARLLEPEEPGAGVRR